MAIWKGIARPYPRYNIYHIAAFLIIVAAVGVRLLLLALGWPPLDSDEGTVGLMGMHIAFRGEFPIFFYGQGYMGAFEAYLAAITFLLFGVSTFTLSLGLVLVYAGFLIAMYFLVRLLYSNGLALFVLLLLSLGSNPMLSRELVAIGGYPETLFFGVLLMLLASWLALTSRKDIAESSKSERRRRLLAYGGWGLVAGVGIWTHLLVVPFALIGGLLLVLFCRRELLGRAGLLTMIVALIGLSPMIIYNSMVPFNRSTLYYLKNVHSAAGTKLPPPNVLWPEQIKGAFLISLPTATGANPLCSPSQVPVVDFSGWQAAHCTLVHTGWTLGVIILWVLAALFVLGALKQMLPTHHSWSPDERKQVVVYTARLALLITGALTFFLYIVSPDAALFPVATSRYLIGLLVSTPAVLWPLWHGTDVVKPQVVKLSSLITISVQRARLGMFFRSGLLVLICLVLLVGMFSTFTGIPPAPPVENYWGKFATQVNDQHLGVPSVQALNRRQYALIQQLLHMNIIHIYSDYWTCNRLMFQSQEHIICGVLADQLQVGSNRYAAYWQRVHNDRRASYVFPIGSPQAVAFARRVKYSTLHDPVYRRYVFDGYVVYKLLAPCRIGCS